MKTPIKFILSFALLLLAAADIAAQELITNVYGRDVACLATQFSHGRLRRHWA